MRIDPRRWGRQRVLFDLAGGSSKAAKAADGGAATTSMLSVGQWECEGFVEGQDGEAEPAVAWVFKTRDGQVRRRETVRLTQRSAPHTDNFTTLLERMSRPAPAATPAAPEPAAEDELADASTATAAATAPVRGDAAYRSPSPPPYVPAAPRNLIYNEEDAFQLMASALDDSERDAAHAMERAAYRELALGALEELGAVDEVAEDEEEEEEDRVDEDGRPLPKVEGFAADDEDDSDLFETLRLRGGGGVEMSDDSDSDSDSSSDSESSSDSDSDDDEESSNTVKQATSSEEPAAAPKVSLQDKLTTLFKPSGAPAAEEQGGFSLLAGMDLDLDPDAVRTPSPEPEPLDLASSAAAPLPPQHAQDSRRFVPPTARDGGYRGGAATPRFTGPSRPFFPLPSGAFGEGADAEALLGQGAADKVAHAMQESRARIEGAARDFYRHETQCVRPFLSSVSLARAVLMRIMCASRDQIDDEHYKLRELLRGHARKRHREAVKRTKKSGTKRGAAVSLDIIDD